MRQNLKNLSRIAVAWMLLLIALLITALVWRHSIERELAESTGYLLSHCYRFGLVDYRSYIHDWPGPPLQAKAVYLMERGQRYQDIERELLICEALRSYDSVYIYPRCLNYDLRMLLIERCLEEYPEDAEVHWAAGRILLTAGHWDQAADELQQALEKRLDWIQSSERNVFGRLATALLLSGEEEAAEDWNRQYAENHLYELPDDQWGPGFLHYSLTPLFPAERYVDMLLREGKYDEALHEFDNRFKPPFDLLCGGLKLRTMFWSGQLTQADVDNHAKDGDGWQERIGLLASRDSAVGQDLVQLATRAQAYCDEYDKLQARIDYEIETYGNSPVTVTHQQALDRQSEIGRLDLGFPGAAALVDCYAVIGEERYLEPVVDALAMLHDEISANGRYYAPRNVLRLYDDLGHQVDRALAFGGEWDTLWERYQASQRPGAVIRMRDAHVLLGAIACNNSLDGLFEPWQIPQVDPLLLVTPVFRAAAEYGGWEYEDAVAAVAELLVPSRQHYFDYGNGRLNIPGVELAECDW